MCSTSKKNIVVDLVHSKCYDLTVSKEAESSSTECIHSNEPCDYCVDRQHRNCKHGRTEYFPLCFKGLKVIAC